jgi:hypothetical protein
MSPVSATLDDLRRRLRRTVVWRGLAWTAATLLAGVLFAAAADAAWRIEAPLARWLILAAVLGATVVVLLRTIRRPLKTTWDDVSLALLIERLRPAGRDQLASAAAFASPEGREAVRDDLRSAAIRQAEITLAGIQPATLIDRRGQRRATGALLTVAGILAAWLIADTPRAALAIERLVRPFDAPEWPRSTVLALLGDDLSPLPLPQRGVADEPLTLYIANTRGGLPRDLQLERAAGEGPPEPVDLTRTTLRNAAGREQEFAVATLTPAAGLLQLRAVGGDDRTMSWHDFDIRPAPRLERFHIHVEPPAYSGLSVVDEERASGHVEGLIGSRVALDVEANVPLQEVRLHRDGQVSEPLPLDADGRRFQTELTVTTEGRATYWFDLRDQYGLAAVRPQRYELRGRRDQPPLVKWVAPGGPLTVTPNARLPLDIELGDDLGLGRAELEWSSAGDEQVSGRQPLPAPQPVEGDTFAKSQQLSVAWDLTPLKLSAGRQFNVSSRSTICGSRSRSARCPGRCRSRSSHP